MTTPKEKAIELVERFSSVGLQRRDEGVKCALICAEEMIKNLPSMDYFPYYSKDEKCKEFWQDVKTEIEKL